MIISYGCEGGWQHEFKMAPKLKPNFKGGKHHRVSSKIGRIGSEEESRALGEDEENDLASNLHHGNSGDCSQ